MAAETNDQADGSNFDVSLGVGLSFETTAVKTEASSALGNGLTPKVRKPYTITKQREKWTDEEHQRFLEALKLYGRAWRQIEEHVGTKTAIQIRSHAQKFFAKVTRESNSDFDGSLNPIEIPPPRPKKKPLHPYPRKVVDSHRVDVLDSNQLEQSPSPEVPVGKRGSKSPTSVFSALGSETSESPFLELQKSRLSPASCTTDDAHSANVLFTENENECMTSNTSVQEEKGPFESIQVSASAITHEKSSMELDFLTLGSACFREDQSTEATSSTIKLFGRTVMVNENQKSSSSAADNHALKPSDATKEKLNISDSLPTLNSTTDNADPQYAVAYVPGCITPLPILLPPQALSKEFSHPGAVPSSIPWWVWHQGLVFPHVALGNLTAVETAVDHYQGGEENEQQQREGSSTGSNSGSVCEENSGHIKFDAIDSKSVSKIAKQGSMKGFVPYKRCLAERDATSPTVAAEEREGQRPRVCS